MNPEVGSSNAAVAEVTFSSPIPQSQDKYVKRKEEGKRITSAVFERNYFKFKGCLSNTGQFGIRSTVAGIS